MFNCIHDHRRHWFQTKVATEPDDFLETKYPYAPPIPQGLTDDEIVAAVQALPDIYREVVLLADVEEFSYKEIADVLRVPMGTVMSRLSRARKALRVKLAGVVDSYGIGRAAIGGATRCE
jgi:RNA polymerase sigma-70 factor (ECF subfamily)